MVKSYPNLLTTQPELVARHYTEAQSEDLALPYWTRAGERALERSANYEAVDHFSNALAIAEQLPEGELRNRETLATRLLLAKALESAGRLVAATTHFQLAAEQARAAGDTDSFVRAALGSTSPSSSRACPPTTPSHCSRRRKRRSPPEDDRRRCLILTDLARAHVLRGDLRASARFEKRATELARRLDDRMSLFHLLVNRHLVPRQVEFASELCARVSELDELIRAFPRHP